MPGSAVVMRQLLGLNGLELGLVILSIPPHGADLNTDVQLKDFASVELQSVPRCDEEVTFPPSYPDPSTPLCNWIRLHAWNKRANCIIEPPGSTNPFACRHGP